MTQNKSRKRSDKAHARIYSAWLDLPAWQALTPYAKALLIELLARYRPMDGNHFPLSGRKAAELLNCSRNAASAAIGLLEETGWVRVEKVGTGLTGRRCSRTSHYRLTMFPSNDWTAPTRDFEKWSHHGRRAA
jgi:hypothetical protein